MKTKILLLGILLSVTTLMAQERTFKNFDIVKGEREYFIVKPKNYDNLLQSLKIYTLIFPQHKEVVYFSMKGYVLEDITEEQLQNILILL